MRWITSCRARRLILLSAIAAGWLLPTSGCGGSNSGTMVPTPTEHGKKNREMEEFMKTQKAK